MAPNPNTRWPSRTRSRRRASGPEPQYRWPSEERILNQQQERYKGRNVVERCFNKLKQWRGIAMRTDKLARNYRAAIALAATLIWLRSTLINTT